MQNVLTLNRPGMREQMETNDNPVKEVLEELFTLLESLETQSTAVLQFLKDQGITPDKKLAPYLERAGNASSVKWRAARVRMEYLLAPIQKEPEEKDEDKDQAKGSEEQQNKKAKREAEDNKENPAGKANADSKNQDSSPKGDEKKPNDQKGKRD
jgi:hypothetical protein